jgi:CHAD domain-containing protein
MAFRLKLQEDLAEEVRRVALEQVELAEQRLANVEGVPTAIHDVRRCLKRLRALARLLRPSLAESVYAREAKRLAGIGRLLSEERDLQVMCETLDRLEARSGPLPNGAAGQVKKLLAHGRRRSKGRNATADHWQEALAQLARVRKFFNIEPENLSFDVLAQGLEHAYRKGRKAFRHVHRNPSDETIHALRKAVQLHWRHMLLLSRGWPEALGARAHEARELSRLLGDDHDIAVLLGFIRADVRSANSIRGGEARAELCRSWQAEIRAQAQPLGERLFADRAGDLRKRVETYWDAARRLRALAQDKEQEATPQPADATSSQEPAGSGA